MNQEQVDIKTPEFVSLQFQSAGLGSRTAAFIIDQFILTIGNILIIIGLLFVLYGFNDLMIWDQLMSFPIAITIIILFLLNWGYFFALEYFSGGKTIGKRIIGIRVIQDNGHSLTLLSSFIRNLLRIIDSLPANYLLGIAMIFFHSKNKRIGDLVAGTIVVHERKRKKIGKLTALEKEINRRGLTKNDLIVEGLVLRAISNKEWNLLKTYSNRILQLKETEREQLTKNVAEILFSKVGLDIEGKTNENLENTLFILYLLLREEWEFEL